MPLELKTSQDGSSSRAGMETRFCPEDTLIDDFLPSLQAPGGMNGAMCNQRSKLPKNERVGRGLAQLSAAPR